MEAKFYVSLFLFVCTCFLFPTMYTEALNANITDTNLQTFIVWLPVVILIVMAVLPTYYGLEEYERGR